MKPGSSRLPPVLTPFPMKIRRRSRQANPSRPEKPAEPVKRGSRGFRQHIRERLAGRGMAKLTELAIEKAENGRFDWWEKLVDLHEAELVNSDDLQEFIEILYQIVRKHVLKLDDGKAVLAEIARDLKERKLTND